VKKKAELGFEPTPIDASALRFAVPVSQTARRLGGALLFHRFELTPIILVGLLARATALKFVASIAAMHLSGVASNRLNVAT
jgi:hypothetical protein